jgi:hypothetical protein
MKLRQMAQRLGLPQLVASACGRISPKKSAHSLDSHQAATEV